MQGIPKSRPTGVTIIAILNVIGGIIMLFGGLTLIAIRVILPTLPPTTFNQSGLQGNLTAGQAPVPPDVPPTVPQSLLGGIGIAIGGVLLALAIASFVVAYGLLKGLEWAWTVTIVVNNKHNIECNLNCCWQYRLNYQYYHQWNHPVLPIQTTCEGLLW